jgi:hypothetical protein
MKDATPLDLTKIRPDPDWAVKVRQGLLPLFDKLEAKLVESTCRDDHFGFELAVIVVGNIILRVSRDVTLPPEYIEARIAPVYMPNDFKPPLTACMALVLTESGKLPPVPPYKEFGTFDGLSRLLLRNFAKLNDAFTPADYPSLREKMIEIEQQHWRDWALSHSERIKPAAEPRE